MGVEYFQFSLAAGEVIPGNLNLASSNTPSNSVGRLLNRLYTSATTTLQMWSERVAPDFSLFSHDPGLFHEPGCRLSPRLGFDGKC